MNKKKLKKSLKISKKINANLERNAQRLVSVINLKQVEVNAIEHELKAALLINSQREQHLLSCEAANNELHEKISTSKQFYKDLISV